MDQLHHQELIRELQVLMAQPEQVPLILVLLEFLDLEPLMEQDSQLVSLAQDQDQDQFQDQAQERAMDIQELANFQEAVDHLMANLDQEFQEAERMDNQELVYQAVGLHMDKPVE